MDVKEYLKRVFDRFVVLNLVAMFIVIILLCVGVGYGLDAYTHHGENIEVPNLKGMDYKKAYLLLDSLGLGVAVSDSGYHKGLPANSILLQTPGAGQHVKQGHMIYVTVNSPSSPAFTLPDIIDNSSLREAEAKLTAMGFRLEAPELIDGEKDWVYGIICQGRKLANGARVSTDYPLTLVVGKGTIDDLDDIDIIGVEGDSAVAGTVDEFLELKEP